MIHLTGVRKAYRSAAETVWVSREVDLDVHRGEFVCIFGASGSGKTSLLNMLSGLDVADAGEIRVDGVSVSQSDENGRADLRLRTVGVIFQEHHLIDEFTVIENISLTLEVRGMSLGRARSEGARLLNRVGLSGLGDRFPSQLSGGQKTKGWNCSGAGR